MADLDVDLENLKENRFAHLLKPIRDLQDNFNVDLAAELEEYLEQLENAQFAFEGARHVAVDFAEAALLIQASTLVYSKKVEYLYSLTYQALEAMKGRRRPLDANGEGDKTAQPTAGARGRAGALARATEEDEEDSLERVWDSEPYLKDASDLDLAPDEGSMPNAGTAMRPPAALLSLEDHGQGAISGAAGKDHGDAGVYRLQQCIVHCSGALLLDPRDADLYDYQLRFMGPQPKHDKGLEQLIEAHRWEQPTQPIPMPVTQPHMPGAEQQDGPSTVGMDQGPAQDFGDDDGGGYGGGGDWPSDDDGAPAAKQNNAQATNPTDVIGTAATGGAAMATADCPNIQQASPARIGETAGSASVGESQQPGAEAPQEAYDPYKPLDPAAKSSRLPNRPLVVRRPRKTQRTGTAKVAAHTSGLEAAYGLLLPEFAYCLSFLRPAHSDTEVVGVARQTKHRSDRVVRLATDLPAPVFDASDAAAAVAADEAAAEEAMDDTQGVMATRPYGFDDDDDGADGFGGGAGGGASDLDDDMVPGAAGPSGFTGDQSGMANAWHNLPGTAENADAGGWPYGRGVLPGRVPPMGGLGGSEDGMQVDGEEPTYEELCRAHMEAMIMAATAREVQSDLSRRVSNWRQRIDPILKVEESRPAFDIQDYGELIIKRLSDLKLDGDAAGGPDQEQQLNKAEVATGAVVRQHINFSQVAAELEKFEVSRLFSAMLQLINNRNVVIHKAHSEGASPGEVPHEPLSLELLSTDLYHKTIGARLALPQQAGGAIEGGEQENKDIRGTQPAGGKAASGRGKARGGAKRTKRFAADRPGEGEIED